MTNQKNIDLDYLFNSKAVAKKHAGRRIAHRQFYGQDGQLPTRYDILMWSVVFIGMFVFLGMTRTSDGLRHTHINSHSSIIHQI
jgi:hypothetical protein